MNVKTGTIEAITEGQRADFERSLHRVAMIGLEKMEEFLKTSNGAGSEIFQRTKDKAKVSCVAVAAYVRHEQAKNNEQAIEQQRARQIGKRDAA